MRSRGKTLICKADLGFGHFIDFVPSHMQSSMRSIVRFQLRDVTWRGLAKLLEMGLLGKFLYFLGPPLFSISEDYFAFSSLFLNECKFAAVEIFIHAEV